MSLDLNNFDQNIGVKSVRVACRLPTKTIAENAGAWCARVRLHV
jgi:hypothetical protein